MQERDPSKPNQRRPGRRSMRDFLRALRLALRYRFTIAAALVCSLIVGVMWGANIGTVYPFVQVVFRGESMHEWADKQIQIAELHIQELDQKLADARKRISDDNSAAQTELARQISGFEMSLQAEKDALLRAQYLQPIIRDYLPKEPFDVLLLLIAFVVVGTVIRNICMAANILLVERVGQQMSIELRQRCFRNVLDMEMKHLDRRHTGEMMSYFTDNMQSISEGVKAVIGTGIREPLKMTACLVGAIIISWQLLLLSMVFLPVVVIILVFLQRSVKAANMNLMKQTGRMYRRLAEAFMLLPLVKAFTLEESEFDRFSEAIHTLRKRSMRMTWYHSAARCGGEVLGISVVSLALLMGGYLVLNQETHIFGMQISQRPLSAASLMLFYAFLIGAHEPSRKLQGLFAQVNAATMASARIFPILDYQSSIISPPNPVPMPRRLSSLTFKEVSFSYAARTPILTNIDLTIAGGETLAIVGPSGGGKTTLSNLILRFYDPNAGSVLLNGTDLRQYDLRELRRHIGLVTQQPMLFAESVRDNIRCGATRAVSDEEIIAAAHKAHAHSFIEQLEGGYDYDVGERGSRLSGGQRQRIALARAILRDPAILILDEATSQIDAESERLIQLALRDFSRDRITILITHRISMLDLADRILVVHDGGIAGLGRHEELIANCDVYRTLYQGEIKNAA